MNNEMDVLVAETLRNITPGQIVSLFLSYKIDFRVEHREPGEKPLGRLSCWDKWWWIVTVRKTDEEDGRDTLFHELFHLYLFMHGIDHPSGEQKYDDRILNGCYENFAAKYPHFPEQLWTYFELKTAMRRQRTGFPKETRTQRSPNRGSLFIHQ